MMVIHCRYLTGRVVAASDADRQQFQYPPDPARLFMALVAAAHEGHADEDEHAALAWLETLPPPQIVAPEVSPREVLTTFVPVNDKVADPSVRAKQPRFFPSAHVGDQPVRFVWPDVSATTDHADSLGRLLARVVRLGHSSSLIQMWLSEEDELDDGEHQVVTVRYQPDARGGHRFRVFRPGLIERLNADHNGPAVERYAELSLQIDHLKSIKKKKAAKALEAERQEAFPSGPPKTRRPVIRSIQNYRSDADTVAAASVAKSDFDPVVLVLAKMEGNTFDLVQTLALTGELRSTILSRLGDDAPAVITGHDQRDQPGQSNHIALVPLAHTGSAIRRQAYDPESRKFSRHPRSDARGTRVDGHVMGLGIVVPREMDDDVKAESLGELLVDADGLPSPIHLFGQGGDPHGGNHELEVALEQRPRPPVSLRAETWNGLGIESSPGGCRFWTTVTPIVLDRHPKTDPRKDRTAWRAEVAGIIERACGHIGLPPPVAIDLSRHGFVAGVPSAHRHKSERTGHFPLLSVADGKPHRLQIHALLEFDRPVVGPVLLGAGRFRGYGFCKPIEVTTTGFEA